MIKRPSLSLVGTLYSTDVIDKCGRGGRCALGANDFAVFFTLCLEEYETSEALLKTHMDGEEFKALLAKLNDLTEALNVRFYKE